MGVCARRAASSIVFASACRQGRSKEGCQRGASSGELQSRANTGQGCVLTLSRACCRLRSSRSFFICASADFRSFSLVYTGRREEEESALAVEVCAMSHRRIGPRN